MFDALSNSAFMPHGHCYLWQPALLWSHVSSDAIIALAYFSIPITIPKPLIGILQVDL